MTPAECPTALSMCPLAVFRLTMALGATNAVLTNFTPYSYRLFLTGLGRFGFFNFSSILFRSHPQVLYFYFFGFGIRTPPQCKSIVVCKNTKAESTNFHKVSIKVYRPTAASVKEFLMESPSHLAWLVYLSISHSSESFNNSSTDRHAIWVEHSGRPMQSCIVIFGFSIHTSQQCRNILVCVNKRQEGVNTLQWKVSVEVYRPTTPSVKELFFTLRVVNSFTLGMVGLSICHSSEPLNNGSTDRHAIWAEDLGGPNESYTIIFGFSIRTYRNAGVS